MANLSWSSGYSVGVEELDAQHRNLIRLINRIPEDLRAVPGDAALGSLLTALVDYASEHFAAEEARMRLAAYPGLEEHAEIHAAFQEQVLGHVRRYRAEGLIDLPELLALLVNWLIDHILHEDARYAPYLSVEGRRPPSTLHPRGML